MQNPQGPEKLQNLKEIRQPLVTDPKYGVTHKRRCKSTLRPQLREEKDMGYDGLLEEDDEITYNEAQRGRTPYKNAHKTW